MEKKKCEERPKEAPLLLFVKKEMKKKKKWGKKKKVQIVKMTSHKYNEKRRNS